jgi:hypothetical protein
MTGTFLLLIRILIVFALYGFLCWALITIWRDIRSQKNAYQYHRVPEILLQIKESDQIYHKIFKGSEISIGRDPTCDCILLSNTVSARHAVLSHHHSQWWLEDLKSTNGTYINGENISSPIVVIPGDQIDCGDIEINILEEREDK